MENSDNNDEEIEEHAMAETSDKRSPETPKQTVKTSNESDQEIQRQAKKKKSDVCFLSQVIFQKTSSERTHRKCS